jgi:hypothetical protein
LPWPLHKFPVPPWEDYPWQGGSVPAERTAGEPHRLARSRIRPVRSIVAVRPMVGQRRSREHRSDRDQSRKCYNFSHPCSPTVLNCLLRHGANSVFKSFELSTSALFAFFSPAAGQLFFGCREPLGLEPRVDRFVYAVRHLLPFCVRNVPELFANWAGRRRAMFGRMS